MEIHLVSAVVLMLSASGLFMTSSAQHVCTSVGFFPDSSNCTVFYRCTDIWNNSIYQQYVFHCPPGTVFDDRIDVCNWPWAVPGCGGGPPTSGPPVATTASPPGTAPPPPAVTAAPPAVTAQPPAVTAATPAVTAQPPAVTAQPPAVTAVPPVFTPVVTAAPPSVTAATPLGTEAQPVVTEVQVVVTAAPPAATEDSAAAGTTSPELPDAVVIIPERPEAIYPEQPPFPPVPDQTTEAPSSSTEAPPPNASATEASTEFQPASTSVPLASTESQLASTSVPAGPQYKPRPGSAYSCQSPGVKQYEADCQKFWLCREMPPASGLLESLLYRCPEGYLFSSSVLRCAKRETVTCSFSYGLIDFRAIPVNQLMETDLEAFFNTWG